MDGVAQAAGNLSFEACCTATFMSRVLPPMEGRRGARDADELQRRSQQAEREMAFQQAARADLFAAQQHDDQQTEAVPQSHWSPSKARTPKWHADTVGFFGADPTARPGTSSQGGMLAELESMELPPHLKAHDHLRSTQPHATRRTARRAHPSWGLGGIEGGT